QNSNGNDSIESLYVCGFFPSARSTCIFHHDSKSSPFLFHSRSVHPKLLPHHLLTTQTAGTCFHTFAMLFYSFNICLNLTYNTLRFRKLPLFKCPLTLFCFLHPSLTLQLPQRSTIPHSLED
nr:hypothetical protein SPBC32C12.01 - fission yeast (Schizosaccharomyces pombe) [Schizosaccharomyces pombe]